MGKSRLEEISWLLKVWGARVEGAGIQTQIRAGGAPCLPSQLACLGFAGLFPDGLGRASTLIPGWEWCAEGGNGRHSL